MTRWILSALLAAHGVAHLVGFAVTWRWISSPDVPFSTRILAGHVDVGDAGIRMMGVFWLAAAAAFVAAAVGVALQTSWALAAVVGAVGVSLAMCAMSWPESRIGLYVNVALVLVMLLGPRLGLRLVSLVPGPTPAPVDRIQ